MEDPVEGKTETPLGWALWGHTWEADGLFATPLCFRAGLPSVWSLGWFHKVEVVSISVAFPLAF